MTGITPPAFTFSGMWVDWPPITRRPTTRFAYCTGMRRSPRSTSTMKATTAIIIARITISVNDAPVVGDEDVVIDIVDRVREADDDTGEDDQRHAVADAAFGDLLAEPHDKGRAGGQRENRHQREAEAGMR